MKKNYYDDPESYWQEIESRKEENGQERMRRWERENPNHVYGHSEPKAPKE